VLEPWETRSDLTVICVHDRIEIEQCVAGFPLSIAPSISAKPRLNRKPASACFQDRQPRSQNPS